MSSGKVFFAMKNLYKLSAILFVLINFSCAIQNPVSAQREYINSQVFYDQLSPYGEWVNNPDYGYVWILDVDQDFSPYSTSGYWVNTNYGWTWVSDYSWGWATFHYGRWDFNNYYGWFWVPDNEWGPSWVTWRTGNGYYGWTPMRPGISLSLSFGNNYRDLDRWNFVRESDFGRSDINRYYADRNDYNRIILNSRVINNTYTDRNRNSTYISGPSRSEVQRVTGRKIGNITIRDNDRPGQVLKNSQLQIYRPRIQNNDNRGQKPVPARITNLKDIKPTRERINSDQRGKVSPTENNRREQQPQRQVEPQKQQQQQQIERRNQDQQQQQQIERRNQDQQQQQQQSERQKEQVEKQQNEKQHQMQLQQQQQDKRNQEQQVKQQNEQQKQIQRQQVEQQKQVQQQQVEQQKQVRRNQEQQVKQQKVQQRQVQQKAKEEQKQNRRKQEQQ